jgi:hypothetical protein
MALPAAAVYEVRSTGAATNGGGYNSTRAGATTDYSQQAAAQFSYTDLVIGAANSVTSAAFPFTAAAIGNFLHINSGVNFTPGFYEVTTVVGAVATLDRSPGTLAASGGNGKLGGALSSVVDLPTLIDGNVVWVVGSFTTAVQWLPTGSGTDGRFNVIQGYGTVRGDNGLAIVTASANLAPILTLAAQTMLRNFKLDGANLADRGIECGVTDYLENVWVTRCNFSGVRAQNVGTRINRCLFTFCGAGAATGVGLDAGNAVVARGCEAHDCKQGFTCSNGSGDFEYCMSHGNTGSGFYQQGANGMRLRNCMADGNAVDGLHVNDSGGAMAMEVTNCLFTNNAGVGTKSVATDYSAALAAPMAAFFQNNAFYNNTGGNYSQMPAGASDVILTADPYTNRAGGDYSLNGTTGGGAALRGAGIPGGFGLLGAAAQASIGHADIGAVQTLGAAAPPTDLAGLISLWREFTGEHDTAVPDDTVVALWIDRGLEALNRRLRYHWTTDSTSIVLVAGTQEYSLPVDYVEVRWVEWNGRRLAKGDVQEWQSRGDNWRQETTGEPLEYAQYGDKIIFRPVPSAEAVVIAASPVFRYCSKPPAVATSGPEQLSSQNWPVVVAFGAALYCGSYPDSAAFAARRDSLMKYFEDEVQVVAVDYKDRGLDR